MRRRRREAKAKALESVNLPVMKRSSAIGPKAATSRQGCFLTFSRSCQKARALRARGEVKANKLQPETRSRPECKVGSARLGKACHYGFGRGEADTKIGVGARCFGEKECSISTVRSG